MYITYVLNVATSKQKQHRNKMTKPQTNIMKFSQAISWVRWFSFIETNVSKTISVLILRVVELMWVRWTTQSFYLYLSKLCSQGCPFATGDL